MSNETQEQQQTQQTQQTPMATPADLAKKINNPIAEETPTDFNITEAEFNKINNLLNQAKTENDQLLKQIETMNKELEQLKTLKEELNTAHKNLNNITTLADSGIAPNLWSLFDRYDGNDLTDRINLFKQTQNNAPVANIPAGEQTAQKPQNNNVITALLNKRLYN